MTLAAFNQLAEEDANQALYQCCGATVWVDAMMEHFPFEELTDLYDKAGFYWFDACTEADWLEAFAQHPNIAEAKALQEQFSEALTKTPDFLATLGKESLSFEQKFGYRFLMDFPGKSLEDILTKLRERFVHDDREELVVSMNEQYNITTRKLAQLFQP